MKKDKVTTKLVNLTQDLTANSSEGDMQLDTIRRVVGYNMLRNRQDISLPKLHTAEFEPEPTKEKVLEFGKYAVNKLSDDDKFIVKRLAGKDNVPIVGLQMGEVRLPINPVESPAEWRWNQKVGERMGPFNSQNGLPIWFDFYYFEDKLTVRSQNGSVPYFLFSKAKRNIWLDSFKHNQTVALKAGYVWLLSKLFSSQAGTNDYVGFNIKEGSFTITNEKKWSGQFLDFKGNFSGTLTLQLVQPEKNAFDSEGCSAAQKIEFKYPDEVTFEWKNGQLINVLGSIGEFIGYGNKLTFDNLSLPRSYDTALNHVFIPCQSSPQKWIADFSHSEVFNAKGEAKIQNSSWALPIVRVANPATLSEPENNGGWALRLTPDLMARWIGSDGYQPNAIPNNALVLLYPKALLFHSDKTKVDTSSSLEINQTFSCWNISPKNTPRVPLHLNYKDEFSLIYYCHASEGETLWAGCYGKMQPDRPVFVEGSLSILKDLKGWVIFQAKGEDIKISTLLQDSDALKKQPKPYALENALMIVSQAAGLYLLGDLANDNRNNIQSGNLTLVHGLFRWKPILPDPYVSNLKSGWDISERDKNFNQPTSIIYAQIEWNEPAKPIVCFKGDLLFIAGVGIKASSRPKIIKYSTVQLDDKELKKINDYSIDTVEGKRENKTKLEKVFDNLERLYSCKLLDVSTNMDLIGVSVSPSFDPNSDDYRYLIQNKTLSVRNQSVHADLSMVHIFTLPQVQWEPVRTLPEDQNLDALGWFPENLSSATDGGPSRIISISQELSPIIPEIVVKQIKDEFHKGEKVRVLTTLSFGLKADVYLSPVSSLDRNADSLDIVRPEFSNKKMRGGIQVNMMAESGRPNYESPSPRFAGFMVQTLNGYELFTGTELGLSVLGATLQSDASVESQFNAEFGSGGSNPFVPVTRFDLSGYGASNFSEWENAAALASIGKVQFKIMVGRTAFEVVKFVSKIYPWGTSVTRSVTIERRSGGGVIRKDSGWQATQSGIFNFITPPAIPTNPYQFRPGILKGCFDIKNIRPASNNILQFTDPGNGNNVELAPVYFDANIELDGQLDSNILSRGILGFIQLEPKPDASVNPWMPRLLSVKALRKLINEQGAIGGPIDTMLNVGNSGFKFRATRFEVDVTDNSGVPNFVGVVRGQPALPNNGSWSVVKMAAPSNTADPQEATSADVSRGMPLLLNNEWAAPDPNNANTMKVQNSDGIYRFADPTDLFTPNLPRFDYGFMQNTGSQAFLFRRPVIESGTNEISSSLKPAFADPFALYTTKGVFPPIANTIEFPNLNYKLIVENGTGKFKLSPNVNINNLRSPLIVAQDGVDQIAIEYDLSNLKINLDFDTWNVELDNFYVWTTLVGITKLSGTRFSLRAGSGLQSKLVNVQSLLKPEIQDALNFLPGMGSPNRIGDIDLGMTNGKHEVKVHGGFSKKIELPPPVDKIKLKLKGSTGVDSKMNSDTGIWEAFFGAKIGAELQGKIPILSVGAADVFVVLGLELLVKFGSKASPTAPTGSPGTEVGFKAFEIVAYAGLGVGGGIGPFKAEGYLAIGIVFVYENDTAKLGGLVRLKAEVDLKILAVGLSAELRGVVYKESGNTYCDATGEVAVNVSIFLVININASYAYTTKEKL